MFCKNCGAEITDGKFCQKCGAEITQEDKETVEVEQVKRKKDSTLSVVSCALTFISLIIFPWLSIGGIICGIVDVCQKDKTKRHLGSWFGIIAGFIILLFYVVRLENMFG